MSPQCLSDYYGVPLISLHGLARLEPLHVQKIVKDLQLLEQAGEPIDAVWPATLQKVATDAELTLLIAASR